MRQAKAALLSGFLLLLIILSGVSNKAQTSPDIDQLILEGAKKELANGTEYNPDMLGKYFGTKYKDGVKQDHNVYPGGDVNPKEGVCTDLVVRACRNAGIDLQKMVHEDIIKNPEYYGIRQPDKYIDHRRVWVLLKYFKRNYKSLTKNVRDSLASWQPGDIVMLDIGSKNHFHIGVISDQRLDNGRPLVIHNMSYIPGVFPGKTCEQDVLSGVLIENVIVYEWKILGHYRLTEPK